MAKAKEQRTIPSIDEFVREHGGQHSGTGQCAMCRLKRELPDVYANLRVAWMERGFRAAWAVKYLSVGCGITGITRHMVGDHFRNDHESR